MEAWNVVAGGAVVGVLAACWGHIKEWLWRIANLFVQQVEVATEEAHEALVSHLIAHYPRMRSYDRTYGAWFEYHRDGRYGLVPYEQFGIRTIVFWNGRIPFLYTNAVEQRAKRTEGKNTSDSEATKIHSRLTFLRGTLDVEKLLREACANSNRLMWTVEDAEAKSQRRFVIHYIPHNAAVDDERESGSNGLAWYQQGYYRLISHKPEQLGKAGSQQGSALGGLIFPQRVVRLIREIELWRKNRDWYISKGIPWKRGWMLYGPPGTGKTALARAFAEDLDMPIYVYNLAAMDNHLLTTAWRAMQVNVPCVALLEDVDNVFHGRENVARKAFAGQPTTIVMQRPREEGGDDKRREPLGVLTFDCLLNCLDGVERSEGVFTIITTNDISKIDPALGQPRRLPDGTTEFISTRPGRIDKAVELTYLEPNDKRRLAEKILGEYPAELRTILDFVEKFPDLEETPAQFQERCAQLALASFWKESHEESAEERRNAVLERREEHLNGVGVQWSGN